jgi:inner membrane protein
MDNVCHTLVGAALGAAGLKQRTRFGHAALMVSANLPDLDVLVYATGAPAVAFRRGWTHGVGAQLFLPVLLVGVLWLVGRRGSVTRGRPPLHMGWLLVLSSVGVFSHVCLDYLNNYGIRLLTPFAWQWFYGDALFIIDPWLWLMLGAGVWLTGRWRAPTAARVALVLGAVYVAAMMVTAHIARAAVEDAWLQSRGAEPRTLMVGPVPVIPFRREIIVDAGDRYVTGRFVWPSSVVFDPEEIRKNDQAPEIARARAASADVRGLLVWSRFPYWTLEPAQGGTRVTLGDVRFMTRGVGFSASTVVGGQP